MLTKGLFGKLNTSINVKIMRKDRKPANCDLNRNVWRDKLNYDASYCFRRQTQLRLIVENVFRG